MATCRRRESYRREDFIVAMVKMMWIVIFASVVIALF